MPAKRKSSTISKDDNSQSSKLTIWIAIIGFLGTVSAAIISAYFDYKTAETQIDLPLAYTQKTEATMYYATMTQTISSSTTPQPLWEDIIQYEVIWNGTMHGPWVIPNSNDLSHGDTPSNEIGRAIIDGESNNWEIGPLPSNEISVNISVKSKVTENEWIKLSNTIQVNIKPYSESLTEYTHLVFEMAGGGGSNFKEFPIVELKNGYDQYSINIKNDDYDFFTLEPGEYDVFVLHYTCKSPGIFHVALEQQYTFKSENGTILWTDLPLIYCPEKIIFWDFFRTGANDFIFSPTEYFWSGSGYLRE